MCPVAREVHCSLLTPAVPWLTAPHATHTAARVQHTALSPTFHLPQTRAGLNPIRRVRPHAMPKAR